MEVRTDPKNEAPVAPPSQTLETFQGQTQSCIDQWIRELQDDPDRFADFEQQIDQHYRRGGGQLVASILAQVTKHPPMDERIEQVRQDAAIPLRAPQPQTLQVRLLCGLVLWVTTAYCAPRRTKATDPSEQLVGLYPELAVDSSRPGCSVATQCHGRVLGNGNGSYGHGQLFWANYRHDNESDHLHQSGYVFRKLDLR